MGRALFSQKFLSEPAVREEQDPAAPPLDVPCELWSTRNQFDPDSDEFFKDAQLEHFIDGPVAGPGWTLERNNVDEAPHVVVLENDRDGGSSPSTISSNDNDESLSDSNDSPMAVGTDDPATLLADAYTPVDWQQRFLEAGGLRRQGRLTRITHHNPRRPGSARQYSSSGDSLNLHRTSPVSVFIPPAPYRTSSTSTAVHTAQAQEALQQAAGTPRSPVTRRTVNITPIDIPSEPSLPSPVSPSTPSTPAPNVIYLNNTNTFTTPSPAPNTTPRIYARNRFPRASASSARDSPLTNPRARLSLSRIDTMSLAPHQHTAPVPVPVLNRLF